MARILGTLIVGAGLAGMLAGAPVPVAADVTSDRAAAMLIWPDILVDLTFNTFNTEIQVTNTSQESVLLHCFYENANSHCTNTGEVCFARNNDCFDGEQFGRCRAGWSETDFRVRLTPRQPLGWLASEGLQQFPLTGVGGNVGPDGSSNAGSRIPPVPEVPFTGVLRCIAINDDGTPSDRNVLVGHTTFVELTVAACDEEEAATSQVFQGGRIDLSKANAIGLQAIQGAVNDDRELVLGGPEPEYNGCPNFLIVNHFFDGVENPVSGEEMSTELTLVPCANDYLRQIPGSAVVQYLVYNEFEQRFSTSRSIDCKFHTGISLIDTTDPDRSIFSAGVAGTVVGQSRLNPLGGGLLGVIFEYGRSSASEANIHYQGDRPDPDLVVVP
jgi:hypothetical protein